MTKEEVIISLGLEDAQLRTGLAGTDFFIQNSVKHTLKSLKKLVAINIVELAKDAIDLYDKATAELFSQIFDVDALKEYGVQIENIRKKMMGLRQEGEKLREAIGKEAAKGISSEMRLKDIDEQIQREKDKMHLFEGLAKAMGFGNPEARARFTVEALKHEKAWNELINEKAEIQEKINVEIEKENSERSKNLKILTDQIRLNEKHQADVAKAERTLKAAQFERGTFTLAEMATAPVLQNKRWGWMAREILRTEEWAKENRMLGLDDVANRQQNYADKLYKQLIKENPHLKDPQRENIDKLNEQLMELKQLNKGITLKQSAN